MQGVPLGRGQEQQPRRRRQRRAFTRGTVIRRSCTAEEETQSCRCRRTRRCRRNNKVRHSCFFSELAQRILLHDVAQNPNSALKVSLLQGSVSMSPQMQNWSKGSSVAPSDSSCPWREVPFGKRFHITKRRKGHLDVKMASKWHVS